jgi:hypothetical protein
MESPMENSNPILIDFIESEIPPSPSPLNPSRRMDSHDGQQKPSSHILNEFTVQNGCENAFNTNEIRSLLDAMLAASEEGTMETCLKLSQQYPGHSHIAYSKLWEEKMQGLVAEHTQSGTVPLSPADRMRIIEACSTYASRSDRSPCTPQRFQKVQSSPNGAHVNENLQATLDSFAYEQLFVHVKDDEPPYELEVPDEMNLKVESKSEQLSFGFAYEPSQNMFESQYDAVSKVPGQAVVLESQGR